MGKNKGQKNKSKEKAFTVINNKKSKTKAVKTNLKKVGNYEDYSQIIRYGDILQSVYFC